MASSTTTSRSNPRRAARLGLLLGLLAATPSWALEVAVTALFEHKAMLRIDGANRLLEVGQTSPEGVKLLAADSDQAVVLIDGRRSTLTLGAPAAISNQFSAPPARAVSLWPDQLGMYQTSGHINGVSVQFVVDTGATFVSMNSEHAKRVGIDYRFVGREIMVQTASRAEKAYQIRLKSVRVGDIELRDVDGLVHDGEFPPVILLGMSFLGQLDMMRTGKELRLSKRR